MECCFEKCRERFEQERNSGTSFEFLSIFTNEVIVTVRSFLSLTREEKKRDAVNLSESGKYLVEIENNDGIISQFTQVYFVLISSFRKDRMFVFRWPNRTKHRWHPTSFCLTCITIEKQQKLRHIISWNQFSIIIQLERK